MNNRITAYFTPTLSGRWHPDDSFRYPLFTLTHSSNDSLLTTYTRYDVYQGHYEDPVLPWIWLKDPIDRYILEIQGSGIIVLEDGTHYPIGPQATSGHAYVSVARFLYEQGRIPACDLETLRHFFATLSESDLLDVLSINPRQVYFHPTAGPTGTSGKRLTPFESLAVDPDFIPLGTSVWVQPTSPLPGPWQNILPRLMRAEDTGGAIKGPNRGDIYCGIGPEAGHLAGLLNHGVTLTLRSS